MVKRAEENFKGLSDYIAYQKGNEPLPGRAGFLGTIVGGFGAIPGLGAGINAAKEKLPSVFKDNALRKGEEDYAKDVVSMSIASSLACQKFNKGRSVRDPLEQSFVDFALWMEGEAYFPKENEQAYRPYLGLYQRLQKLSAGNEGPRNEVMDALFNEDGLLSEQAFQRAKQGGIAFQNPSVNMQDIQVPQEEEDLVRSYTPLSDVSQSSLGAGNLSSGDDGDKNEGLGDHMRRFQRYDYNES